VGPLSPPTLTVRGAPDQHSQVTAKERQMASQPADTTRLTQPARVTLKRDTGLQRHRADRTEQTKQTRPISSRKCRMLARWVRRTANREPRHLPLARTPEPLLHYRAAAVRTDLLEIAALLEHAHNPDPARVAALHDLLANGCDSPLYNTDVHISELLATLHYVRSGLRHLDTDPIARLDPGQLSIKQPERSRTCAFLDPFSPSCRRSER
jgi:hypothetical protein